MRFRPPEIFLGCFLTVAIFAMGMLFESSRRHPTEQRAAADTAKENPNHQPERSLWNWVTHDAAGFFTLWLVIVGGGQIGLFYWQLRLIKIAADDAKRAGIAAERAAKATEDSVELSRNTAKRQLRAYVLLDSAKVEPVAAGEKPRAILKIENFGQTPAFQLTHWAAMEYAVFPRTEDPDMSDPDGMPVAYIGGGGQLTKEVPLDYDRELSREEFEAIKSGSAALYVIGRITYVDVFGDAQSTEYIVFVGGSLGLGPHMAGYTQGHKAS
jgi:hypothetical protein